MTVAACGGDSGTEPLDPALVAMEHATYDAINKHRADSGFSSLIYDDFIAQQAREHSRAMADGKVPFGHDGFADRVSAIAQHLRTSVAAENVAFNLGVSDPSATAVSDWLNSPGHLANIEGDFTATGVGVARRSDGAYFFTQIFIKQ